jgi:hypothetical protein
MWQAGCAADRSGMKAEPGLRSTKVHCVYLTIVIIML